MDFTKTNVRPLLKRTLAVFMAVLMVMSTLGVGFAFATDEEAGSPEVLTNGDCGYGEYDDLSDDIKWELYDNGTLYLYGEGSTWYDYSPWSVYANQNDFAITEIILDEGITGIGGYTFCDMENVTSVSLPESLESIDWDAFNGCTALETIFIPENVSYIGSHVFAYCSSLKEFTVDEDNEYFYTDDDGVLYYYEHGYDEYEDYEYSYRYLHTFPAGSDLTEYTVPDIDSVFYYAFCGAENLKKLIVPNRYTYISDNIGWDSEIEVIEGYTLSPAHFAADYSDIEFISIDDVTVEKVELTHLPYQLECEIHDGIDSTGMEFTVTLSDGSVEKFTDGEYVSWNYDTSESGKQTVTVYFLDKTFTFDITVYPERHLILGNEVSFNFYYGYGENFYFTPAKTGKYIFTVGPESSYREISVYEKYEETYEEDGENYTDWWWEWIDDEYFDEDEDGNFTVKLEAGKEYRIRTWINDDEDIVPSTIKVIYKCDHKNQKDHAQQNPNCTAKGYTKGVYCEDCKTWISGHIEIDALGHNTNDVMITKAATCAVDGVKTYSCTVCGTKVKEEKIPATGAHISDGGKETKAATYDAEGVKTYTCTVCKNVIKTETIAKLQAKKPAKVKIKSAKSTAEKKAVVTWNAVKNANGYQVAYSTSKKFAKKDTKTKLIKKVKTTKLTIKKLKSGKKYFVKVRAYKTVGGKKLYGAYSKVKAVKVK